MPYSPRRKMDSKSHSPLPIKSSPGDIPTLPLKSKSAQRNKSRLDGGKSGTCLLRRNNRGHRPSFPLVCPPPGAYTPETLSLSSTLGSSVMGLGSEQFEQMKSGIQRARSGGELPRRLGTPVPWEPCCVDSSGAAEAAA
jgi:hypothetical protein